MKSLSIREKRRNLAAGVSPPFPPAVNWHKDIFSGKTDPKTNYA
jgi:hypothetical protein